ncbi:hypothetical protein [uncultured Sphingomonas sp.]|uniref:hypothetical protein n=1 Tax=uncultured Sphingomonas sp. TaxID=158754 RepID=UPI0035CB8BBB
MNNSNRTALYEIPVPSTDFIADAILCGNVIRYGYESEGHNVKSGLIFNKVKAKRTRAEGACTKWHIEGAYDTLVEIEESEWINEILAETLISREKSGEVWELHHYLIYIDGSGCIEVVAASWKVLDEERGSWT